jgi:heat shock protein HslJ
MSRAVPLILVLAVAGCASASGSPSPSASAPIDPTGPWALRDGSVDRQPIPMVDGYPITLEVSGSKLTGVAACNDYGATLTVRDGRIDIVELAATAKACVEEGVMDSEAAYVRALEAVDAIGMDGAELILGGPDVSLRFARLEPPPTAAMTGTTWLLEALVDGDVASTVAGQPATLLLTDDGQLTGSSGCRDFDGTWVARGDRILTTRFEVAAADCPPALAAQDAQVINVIGDAFTPTIDGGVMTLSAPGGSALLYRAQE